ncbi:MAG: sialate O-acetylesterase [Verrucomicrobia bacterium]|nr:sialate O-acetylesterase [Verrucomicrobiota bacterium]MCG2678690.1 sialate O-acetylesterase [Kiritimatiellia bacterium]MBU4248511.1 sialate O-acetylesterase [Verrucomicrobiota bacterium]MBU4291323.1 sialate O-acetylesterase [Verrucomicrobiota bacterium]MBU4429961.1 sialate O-acetylesterase [Verrucomicrobiota bacterium]
MKISRGLFDRMVLQRNRKNQCDAVFAGECAGAGRVVARVTRNGSAIKGFKHVPVGQAARGAFQGRLRGLIAGGPYEIKLKIESPAGRMLDSMRIRDVLVGDVWILGGQSNMEGIGLIKDAAKPDLRVRAFYMDDRWAVAKDPIHNLGAAVDQVHLDLNGGKRVQRDPKVGTGPGVAFGQEMARRTGVPQGLIACGHGGTSMTQWDPARKNLGGRSLYGATLRRFRKNGSRVAGVVWYQGCSDAIAGDASLYTRRMKVLLNAMRRDFGDSKLPCVAVQIAGVFSQDFNNVFWNSIQDQQRRLPDVITHCAVVPAIDLEYDDGIHISGKDQQRLGRRLAQAMAVLRGDRKAGLPPIALRNVAIDGSRIKVVFDHVMGRLQAAGKPAGFMLGGTQPGNLIFRIDLRGNTAWINTSLESKTLASNRLYYGYGTAPYCNIMDAADRSLPVFGPVPLGCPMATSDFVTQWQVSRALPSAGKLHGLAYPRNRKALGLTKREFTGRLADIHLDLFQCAPQDRLVYYACRIDCPERMNLALGLGYDGPVKLWIDGKPRFHDPNGTNPAGQDKAMIPFLASAGQHDILIALASNRGRAWGISLRFSRRMSPRWDGVFLVMPKVIE